MEVLRTIIDDEPSEVSSPTLEQDSKQVGPGLREGVVYSTDVLRTAPDPQQVASAEAAKAETSATPTKADAQDASGEDEFAFLNNIPQEKLEKLFSHEKVRPVFQSKKDRELAQVRADYETRLAQAQEEARQRTLAELAAREEATRKAEMTDEELGAHLRAEEQRQYFEEQQRQKYWNEIEERVRPQIEQQALNRMYQEGFAQVIEAVGPEAFNTVAPRVQAGELREYKDIITAIVDAASEAKATKQAESMAKQMAERMTRTRVADEHLNEEAPDTTGSSTGRGGVQYLKESTINSWSPEQAARNETLLDSAEREGRILYGQ